MRGAVVAAGALALAATPCGAQTFDLAKTRAIAQDFGECIAQRNVIKQHAIKFVLQGIQADGASIARSDCFASALRKNNVWVDSVIGRYDVVEMRSLVADGLVRADFVNGGPTDFSAVPPLDASDNGKLSEATSEQLRFMLPQLGECAVRRDPEAARRVAVTEVNSPEELAALRAMAPAFGGCISASAALNFSRVVLRNTAVLAYARLAYSLPPGARPVAAARVR